MPAPTAITTGRLSREGRPSLAWAASAGAGPTLLFFPGYASDMAGSKAQAILHWAAHHGQRCLLFDYAGCGQSDGDFAAETLESWRDDALAIMDQAAAASGADGGGRFLLIGSSMGGWLMLLAALARPKQVAGMIGIAAAPDFTDWGFTAEQKAEMASKGRLYEDNPYGPEPTLTTHALWQSGERNRLLDGSIPLDGPVHLLHGQADGDVPPAIALRLATQLRSASVVTTLVKDGDHRLSRPEDIARLIQTVETTLHQITGNPPC